MKELLFTLAVMAVFAAPAMAATIQATDEGCGVVRLDYIRAAGEQRIRAFGLDVTITSGNAVYSSISDFKTGESVAGNAGFGIFPGSITIDGNGVVTSYGAPKAPDETPGANPSGITLELGSLYKGDANSPAPGTAAATVTLCRLHYTGTLLSTLTLSTNNTRGGVLFEDNTPASPTYVGTAISFVVPVGPPMSLTASQGTYAAQITLSWTAPTLPCGPLPTGYDVYYNNKNNSSTCVLLASNVATTSYNHVTNHGETTWFWVKAKNPAGSSAFSNSASGWLTECFPTANVKHTRWITYGRPDCWCYRYNCKGDADGLSEGKNPPMPVGVKDLAILKSAWNKVDSLLTGNMICADFDRTSQGKGPYPLAVFTQDLGILKSSWQLTTLPAGPCEANKSVVPPSGPMP